MPRLIGLLVLFLISAFIFYRILKHIKHGSTLPLDAIKTDKPLTKKQLPSQVVLLLQRIDDKGKKLTALFESKPQSYNQETQMLVEKILTRDVGMALAHYDDMVALAGSKAQHTPIRHSKQTAEQSLQGILEKIDAALANLLMSEYHHQGQKLLEISRYIDSRFENDTFLD